MMTIIGVLLRLAAFWLLAPALPGLIARVKARAAGRTGPPVLQGYRDLSRLWQKSVVLSETASPLHVAGPAIAWVAVSGAAVLLPIGTFRTGLAFEGDVLLLVSLLGLARFSMALAAMDTGSAFEGMGAAREVSFAVLAEASILAALFALSLQSRDFSLEGMLGHAAGAGTFLLALGLFAVLLAENSRVPFDDPETHLELTMVHEVMVLDHGGPPLAVILHGASIKLLLFSVLQGLGALAGAIVVLAVAVGLTESLMARWAFNRVPLLQTTAFLFCLFALLVAWRGGIP